MPTGGRVGPDAGGQRRRRGCCCSRRGSARPGWQGCDGPQTVHVPESVSPRAGLADPSQEHEAEDASGERSSGCMSLRRQHLGFSPLLL